MSLTNLVTKVSYAGNGTTTVFPFAFKIYLATDIVVTETSALGVVTTLVLNADYTVTGLGLDAGGSITRIGASSPPATGVTGWIRRILPLTQTADIRNQSAFYASVHEDVFDKAAMVGQQLQDEINRAISLPFPSTGVSATLPAPTANAVLMWDPTATFLQNGTSGSTAFETLNPAMDGAATPGTRGTVSRGDHVHPTDTSRAPNAFTQAGTGAVASTVNAKLQQVVSVLDFGADPTGVADSSAAFLNAHNTGKRVYAPIGTYLVNLTTTKRLDLIGDGPTETFIKPTSAASAAVNIAVSSDQWSYGNRIEGLTFLDAGTQTGVGITFGLTNLSNYVSGYVAGMEMYNGLTCKNVQFKNLQKGVLRPFGNIGLEFYSCSFRGCKYGAYCLDNKNYPAVGGSTPMHAGNMYFYAGEIDGCTAAIYVDNTTTLMGAINFVGTIIENCNIVLRINNGGGSFVTPILFDGCWMEGNGSVIGGSSTLDTWTGTTLGTSSVGNRSFVILGSQVTVQFKASFFGDCQLTATKSLVTVQYCRVENSTGFSSGPVNVTSNTSEVVYSGCYHYGLAPSGDFQVYQDAPLDENDTVISNVTSDANNRWWLNPYRAVAAGGSGIDVFKNNMAWQPATMVGSLANVTGTMVTDGVVFNACNDFSLPFTAASQRMWAGTWTTTAATGWVVVLADVKVVSGPLPTFSVWDGSANQMALGITIPSTGNWYTIAAMAYTSGSQGPMELECVSSASGTVDLRMSAVQVRQFATKAQALEFIRQRVYVDAQIVGAAVASATTISPTGPVFHVTGTTAVVTINLPYTGFIGSITIIPDGAFTTTNAGNIAIASTAVVSKALVMTYDGTKWYPSY